ncbi:MAG: HAD-IC family P-type ATPase, partial [Elusimicrobiota bacterium]|nr:HAD-IC family P-type ATPase [Elusimicrobiota bacterium]
MPYKKTAQEVIDFLKSDISGLTEKAAKESLLENGFNELKATKKVSSFKLFFESFKSTLVLILLIVVLIQLFFGEFVESLVILIVLIFNALLEVIQTKKAETSLENLKKLSAPNVKVIRDKKKLTIPARELTLGDIVILEAGDYVPSDGRIIEAKTLKVVEGILTGESEPVLKNLETIIDGTPLHDRKNMVFSGTMVVYGRGIFIVTAIGMNTELGKIANLLENAEVKKTQLQIKLDNFSKKLGIGILFLAIVIFGVEFLREYFAVISRKDIIKVIFDTFMFSVAIAVAAIPEALSSIVTIVLAVGTNDMAKKQAIIRKLPAVEILGSTSVICTDKTGTLTQNKMTVVDFFMSGIDKNYLTRSKTNDSFQIKMLNLISVLCNDSHVNKDGKKLGDPTEIAFIDYFNKNLGNLEEIKKEYKRFYEIPFDSTRKIMTTINKIDNKIFMLTKGAPDIIFSKCKYILHNNEIMEVEKNKNLLNEYKNKNENFSANTFRVLAFAMKEINDFSETKIYTDDEKDLSLVGIMAMMDPPRKEVLYAIQEAENAGIKTIMITGDHRSTAFAIARQIGIIKDKKIAITGEELDKMSAVDLAKNLINIRV